MNVFGGLFGVALVLMCPWFVAFVLKCSWCSALALNDFEPPLVDDDPGVVLPMLVLPVTAAFEPPWKLPERAPITPGPENWPGLLVAAIAGLP